MKIVLLSDVHALEDRPASRLDNTAETVMGKLEQVFKYADPKAVILQAGDFCDISRSWGLLNRLVLLLRGLRSTLFAVYGQHDLYMGSWESRDRTILGVLSKMGLVGVLDPFKGRVFANAFGDPQPFSTVVWGVSYGEQISPNLDFDIAKEDFTRVLVIHKRIAVNAGWYGDTEYTDARTFLRDHPEFDLILCGDAHQPFLYQEEGSRGKRTICNTGPLLRREATDAMFEHKPQFFVYDTDERDIVDIVPIVCAPAEEVLSMENYRKQNRQRLDEFIGALTELKASGVGLSIMDSLNYYFENNEISEEVKSLILRIVGGEKL